MQVPRLAQSLGSSGCGLHGRYWVPCATPSPDFVAASTSKKATPDALNAGEMLPEASSCRVSQSRALTVVKSAVRCHGVEDRWILLVRIPIRVDQFPMPT